MDKIVYDDVFCVDCNGWKRQKLADKHIRWNVEIYLYRMWM